jgi:hypothetical protein
MAPPSGWHARLAAVKGPAWIIGIERFMALQAT